MYCYCMCRTVFFSDIVSYIRWKKTNKRHFQSWFLFGSNKQVSRFPVSSLYAKLTSSNVRLWVCVCVCVCLRQFGMILWCPSRQKGPRISRQAFLMGSLVSAEIWPENCAGNGPGLIRAFHLCINKTQVNNNALTSITMLKPAWCFRSWVIYVRIFIF